MANRHAADGIRPLPPAVPTRPSAQQLIRALDLAIKGEHTPPCAFAPGSRSYTAYVPPPVIAIDTERVAVSTGELQVLPDDAFEPLETVVAIDPIALPPDSDGDENDTDPASENPPASVTIVEPMIASAESDDGARTPVAATEATTFVPEPEPFRNEFDEDAFAARIACIVPEDPVLFTHGPEPTPIPATAPVVEATHYALTFADEVDTLERGDVPDRGFRDPDTRGLARYLKLGDLMTSVALEDPKAAHDAYADHVDGLHAALRRLDDRLTAPPSEELIPLSSPLYEQMMLMRVARALDERVRRAASGLYEEALALPAAYREMSDQIRAAKVTYQIARHAFARYVEDEVQRARSFSADLDLLRARLDRAGREVSLSMINEYKQTIARAGTLLNRLPELESAFDDGRRSLSDLQQRRLSIGEQTTSVSVRLDRFLEHCRLFDLPLQPEVAAQIAQARQHLDRAVEERPDPIVSDWTEINAPVDAALVAHGLGAHREALDAFEAMLIGTPTGEFQEPLSRQDQIGRLMVIGYHLIATAVSKRGRKPNVIARLLTDAGYLKPAEADEAIAAIVRLGPTAEEVENTLFSFRRWRNHPMYLPKDPLRDLAEDYLSGTNDPDAIRDQIAKVKAAYVEQARELNAARRSERAKRTGTDDAEAEEPIADEDHDLPPEF